MPSLLFSFDSAITRQGLVLSTSCTRPVVPADGTGVFLSGSEQHQQKKPPSRSLRLCGEYYSSTDFPWFFHLPQYYFPQLSRIQDPGSRIQHQVPSTQNEVSHGATPQTVPTRLERKLLPQIWNFKSLKPEAERSASETNKLQVLLQSFFACISDN